MARTTHVASAGKRKDGRSPYKCYTCHEDIVEGQAYAWNQPSRYSMRYNWHATCQAPRPSTLESNEKRSAAMAAYENGYDALDALRNQETEGDVEFDTEAFITEVKDALQVCADEVREAAELWREAATNIEDGFGHPTSMSEEFEGYADEVESAADEIENIEPDEYDAEQWDDLDQWISSTIDTVVDELGSTEGNLP